MNQLTENAEMDFRVAILEGMLNMNYLEHMDVVEANKLIGAQNLLFILNRQLRSPQFEVRFDFTRVEQEKVDGVYAGLSLQCHELIIPKSAHGSITSEAIDKKFDLGFECEGEDESTRTYKVFLNEERFVTTISQIVRDINCYLGPFVEKGARKLKLTDYHIVFNVDVSF